MHYNAPLVIKNSKIFWGWLCPSPHPTGEGEIPSPNPTPSPLTPRRPSAAWLASPQILCAIYVPEATWLTTWPAGLHSAYHTVTPSIQRISAPKNVRFLQFKYDRENNNLSCVELFDCIATHGALACGRFLCINQLTSKCFEMTTICSINCATCLSST